MNLTAGLREFLADPLASSLDVDDADSIARHRKIIQSKPLLRACYDRWYSGFLPAYEEIKDLPGDMVEIGCGAGYLEEFIPKLIKTDVVPNPFAQRVMDAMKLDFPDKSLKAIFLVGVLHHLADPERFLAEAERCLRPSGRLVMLEPNNCALQRWLCKLLNHYESYDDSITDWRNSGPGRMSNANLALPWVIFMRDRLRFEKEFPGLKLKNVRCHTFVSYYVSGA